MLRLKKQDVSSCRFQGRDKGNERSDSATINTRSKGGCVLVSFMIWKK